MRTRLAHPPAYPGAVSGVGNGGRLPTTVRISGVVTAVEGVVAVVAAIVLVIRELAGHHESAVSGYGTAGWFGLIGLGVIAGGVALLRGRRWGRGVSIVAQLLLLPVAYALLTDSHQPGFGIPLAIVALAILILHFSPMTVRWVTGEPSPHDGDGDETDDDTKSRPGKTR